MIGLAAVLAVALLVLGAVGGLAVEAGGGLAQLASEWRQPATLATLRFTAWQAALSTLLSVSLAIPLACALARRRFVGRRALLHLAGLAFVMPPMVVVLGVVAVHGRHGWVNDLAAALGLGRADYLYGLPGILLAHVFFNLPLAARIFLNALVALPRHHFRLAALYGMRPAQVFRHIEWPLLRSLLPGVAGAVFLLCFTSFAVVLTLGGGPRATTLEVAIYQALRFDFDLPRVVALSYLQIGVCLLLGLVFFAARAPFPLRAGDAPAHDRRACGVADTAGARRIDAAVIAIAAVFLASPPLAVVLRALGADGWGGWLILTHPAFWPAFGTSLAIALPAGALSCLLALAVADLIVTLRRRAGLAACATAAELAALLTLLVPPITLGAGLFLLLRRVTDALSAAPALVVALNALLGLAFGVRVLVPAVALQRERYDRLCAALGIRGWRRWRIHWPALRAPVGFALALASTLAAGDMGVIALFGTDELHTLPLLMYRLLGAYRLAEAAVVAVVLCALCFALLWGVGRLFDAPIATPPTPPNRYHHRRHA